MACLHFRDFVLKSDSCQLELNLLLHLHEWMGECQRQLLTFTVEYGASRVTLVVSVVRTGSAVPVPVPVCVALSRIKHYGAITSGLDNPQI